MKQLIKWLRKHRFPYEPLININIYKDSLLDNLNQFRRLSPNTLIAPVLKSNAYGHGLFEVAGLLKNDSQIPFIVVDSYFEAVALRAKHVTTPLLIIGYTRPETIKKSRLKNTAFTVTNMETLQSLAEDDNDVRIHLKIDTGMHRQGITPDEVTKTLEILKENDNIILEGICTHFCDADNVDESFTEGQIRIWNRIVNEFKVYFPNILYIHAAATDGARYSTDISGNVVRLGIGLYGLSENKIINEKLNLKPVLEMKTIITGVKDIKTDDTVGYGNTFMAHNDMKVATIPVGYFEGLDRRASNKGVVEVGPDRLECSIVGRISMNISTIDVTALPDAKAGTEVIVFSKERDNNNSIRSFAKLSGTIPYEIAVKIPSHLKRVIID